jgi:hypothetical protein
MPTKGAGSSSETVQSDAVPVLEAVERIGGRPQVRILQSLHQRASRPHMPSELREAVERTLTSLEARLAREEAPDVLLRAGQSPSDGLLRAAGSPVDSPDVLLRAGSPNAHA